MSIYCTRIVIGDSWLEPVAPGRVVAYPHNVLARVAYEDWPQGSIDTADIPAWCVPGPDGQLPREEWDGERVADFLRLSVSDHKRHVDVLIDEAAARALAKDLRRWVKKPKVRIGEAIEGDEP